MPQQQLNLTQTGTGEPHAVHEWRIRTSSRARNLRIQVFPYGGVEIVVPEGTSQRAVDRFIAEHREWIHNTQQEYLQRRSGEKLLPDEIDLPAAGEHFSLTFYSDPKARVRENGDKLLVFAPVMEPSQVWPMLQHWLKRKARRHLSAGLTRLSHQTGLYPQKLQVRLQQTRWGSCSPNGTVSLNAAVLLRSAEEMRYVIIHELCHLQHMNHSRRYWRLVERFEPDYRRIDKRLDGAWESTPVWLNKTL